MALNLYSNENTPITLTVKASEIAFREPVKEFVRAHMYKNIILDNVKVENVDGVLVRSWGNDGDLTVNNLTADVDMENLVVAADEDFICKSI